MNNSKEKISIIIRCKNEEKFIGQCLKKIFQQEIDLSIEIIIIDSGSTDNTVNIVKKFPVRIYYIEPNRFNYASALNFGMSKTSGQYVVILSAHILPLSPYWLEKLLRPLRNDSLVAGAFSRQLSDKNNFFEYFNSQEVFPVQPRVYDLSSLPKSDTAQNFENIIFSNACCAIRKDLAIKIPFRELPFCEDRDWAKKVIKRGFKIIYVPDSQVMHNHEYQVQMYAKKYLQSFRALCQLYEIDHKFFYYFRMIYYATKSFHLKNIQYQLSIRQKIRNFFFINAFFVLSLFYLINRRY